VLDVQLAGVDPVVEPEWRGGINVEMLKRLRAYGRLAD
jgi:hypothetical protein